MQKSTPVLKIGEKRLRHKPPMAFALVGEWLKDAKEEAFCLLIADGLAVALAWQRAGFTLKDTGQSAIHLLKASRIRARVEAILAARRAHAPVQMAEVTDMLKRVYVGAIHDSDYTPAHNAAFSLARLHGLVVDRAQLDVIRRPSREPDAPAELALADWINALPGAVPPGPVSALPNFGGPEGLGPVIEGSAFGSDLDGPPGRDHPITENGAPGRPVTGTPFSGGHSDVDLGGRSGEISPSEYPNAEDLF